MLNLPLPKQELEKPPVSDDQHQAGNYVTYYQQSSTKSSSRHTQAHEAYHLQNEYPVRNHNIVYPSTLTPRAPSNDEIKRYCE